MLSESLCVAMTAVGLTFPVLAEAACSGSHRKDDRHVLYPPPCYPELAVVETTL